jgi:hypothetical protein
MEAKNLRCKVGDMAIIIGARITANLGRYVTVDSAVGWLAPNEEFTFEGNLYKSQQGGHMWLCTANSEFVLGTLENPIYRKTSLVYDHDLLPIRPEPDEDEFDEGVERKHDEELQA